MRKAFFFLAFTLLSTGAFAEFVDYESFDWNTPDGKYSMVFFSESKNSGQQTTRDLMEFYGDMKVNARITLSNTEWGLIKRVLDSYTHRRGDTYVIGLSNNPKRFNKVVVIEFSSAAQYNYWAWSYSVEPLTFPLSPRPRPGEELGPPPEDW